MPGARVFSTVCSHARRFERAFLQSQAQNRHETVADPGSGGQGCNTDTDTDTDSQGKGMAVTLKQAWLDLDEGERQRCVLIARISAHFQNATLSLIRFPFLSALHLTIRPALSSQAVTPRGPRRGRRA